MCVLFFQIRGVDDSSSMQNVSDCVYIYILCIYIVYYINLHHILYTNIFQVVPRLETERLENKVLTLRKTS